MTDISIRPGRIEDIEAISAFTQDTFSWGDYVASEFPNWLDQSDVMTMVATDADEVPVAMARVGLLSAEEAWLSAARVHPDYRRRGIGSELNHHGASWAREHGAKVVRLATEEENIGARAQVEKLGYRPVARFALAVRTFEDSEPRIGSNGGRRLPGPERLDLAPAAEAEPAYMVWITSDQARVAHRLYPADGWAFRRLRSADVVEMAKARRLWTSPAAWVATVATDDRMWIPLFITTLEDSDRAARALIDLAQEKGAPRVDVMVPRVAWLEEALERQHFAVRHPNLIYEKTL